MESLVSIASQNFVGWFDKIHKYFEDFKPETRTMIINYSKRTSVVGLFLNIDEGFRKNHNKIKIPHYPGFEISRMQDAVFRELKFLWKLEDGQWILDAKSLPPSDGYFIELEGAIEEKAVKDLVHIQPAINRDSDKVSDKYWLDSCIKNPELLEKAWTHLQINDIDVGVSVDFNKMFALKVPQEIQDKADAIKNYLSVGSNPVFDRNLIYKALHEYRRQERKVPFHPTDFIKVIQSLTARDTLMDYLSVDASYKIGEIAQPTKYSGIIPLDVKVQTFTTLTLRSPQALGYLTFKRQKYLDKLQEEFSKLMKHKK